LDFLKVYCASGGERGVGIYYRLSRQTNKRRH